MTTNEHTENKIALVCTSSTGARSGAPAEPLSPPVGGTAERPAGHGQVGSRALAPGRGAGRGFEQRRTARRRTENRSSTWLVDYFVSTNKDTVAIFTLEVLHAFDSAVVLSCECKHSISQQARMPARPAGSPKGLSSATPTHSPTPNSVSPRYLMTPILKPLAMSTITCTPPQVT